jgi:succinate dehydrogenase/fumarate reductase flavoprotein subunit
MRARKEFKSDVLVVGGGLAGCFAAYRAAQMRVSVLLVDKARVGTTGCSAFAAGDILWWTPEDDLNAWLNNYARWGGYLLDPEWFALTCHDIHERVLDMDRWGAPFERTPEGKLARKPGRGHNAAVVFPGIKLMDLLRRKVEGAGARIVDRVMVTDLIVEEGRLAGAVGFDITTGEFCIIEAKAVILAAGGCSWKGNYFGQDMVCGEAYALAYRHGARLVHMEYSNTYNSTSRHFDVYGMSRFQRLGGKFTNALGERFMHKYDPELGDGAFCHTLALGMAKEVRDGRGPIYFDLFDMNEEDRSLSRKLLPMLIEMFDQAGMDIFKERLEWVPAFQGSVGTASGILLVDHSCASTAEGIYAAGDSAAEGLVIGGINGPGAINLTWAIVTGYRSGEGAAVNAQGKKSSRLPKGLADNLETRTFSFLDGEGDIKPQDAYYNLQELVIGWDKSIIRHEKRMKDGLASVERLRSEVLPRIKAADPHQLMRAHEVAATLLTTEIVLESALFRKESRAGHYREDYPQTDNRNWLKWVVVDKRETGPSVEAIEIPRHHYGCYGIELPA